MLAIRGWLTSRERLVTQTVWIMGSRALKSLGITSTGSPNLTSDFSTHRSRFARARGIGSRCAMAWAFACRRGQVPSLLAGQSFSKACPPWLGYVYWHCWSVDFADAIRPIHIHILSWRREIVNLIRICNAESQSPQAIAIKPLYNNYLPYGMATREMDLV